MQMTLELCSHDALFRTEDNVAVLCQYSIMKRHLENKNGLESSLSKASFWYLWARQSQESGWQMDVQVVFENVPRCSSGMVFSFVLFSIEHQILHYSMRKM